MRDATNSPAALRGALLLDAAASGAMGVLLVLAAAPLAPLLGLPAALLRGAGIVLLPYAGLLAWLAPCSGAARGAVQLVIGANALWVVASLLLLVSGRVTPTPFGTLFVLLQAAAVAVFALLEYRGLAREGALRSAPSSAAAQR
jgi:hypothetical protein